MYRAMKRNKKDVPWITKDNPTLTEFLSSLPTREEDETVWFHTQCSVSRLLTDSSGKFAAGSVLRFEQLQDDFDQLCRKLELGSVTLPGLRSGLLPAEQAALYDDYSRRWVSEVHGDDIERFGYEFPSFPEFTDV
jgi:hypothetical protein